jgi:perosamine synthetase
MIRVNDPLIKEREKQLVMEALEGGWISSEGPMVKKFEDNFSHYLGVEFGIAVSNGTVAIETALYALNIQEGDEIIVPSFTIISCVSSIIKMKAIPVLVDIEPETWCIDPQLIEAKITKKTKAIMAVHMYGHPCDMDPILAIAKKHHLYVIEDAAEVHGALYKGKKCGSLGDISTFSFYANKLITTGEGGMVVTNNVEFKNRAQSFRNLCFIPEQRFYHLEMGNNYRLTNIQAALGVGQLERIEEIVDYKRECARLYRHYLSTLKGVKLQVEKEYAKSVYWMYCVQLDPSYGLTAKEAMKKLEKLGIGTRPFFMGMHLQPCFHKMNLFLNESYPVTEAAHTYGFYLPSGMNLTESQIIEVCEKFKSILKQSPL